MTRLEVRPVTPERWDDLAALFEAKGGPHYCWCAAYRSPDKAAPKAEKKQAMHDRVAAGTPVGLLAYDDGAPVAWCSVAPRETYALERSRSMPRVADAPTWTVLCFFVDRGHRGRGAARTLLEAAVRYAADGGAEVIEGYPFDTAGVTATHHGHSSVFAACGFQQDGRRWWRRP